MGNLASDVLRRRSQCLLVGERHSCHHGRDHPEGDLVMVFFLNPFRLVCVDHKAVEFEHDGEERSEIRPGRDESMGHSFRLGREGLFVIGT